MNLFSTLNFKKKLYLLGIPIEKIGKNSHLVTYLPTNFWSVTTLFDARKDVPL